jgi:hypothetical protein
MAAALRAHGESLAREVLALEVSETEPAGEPDTADAELGVRFWLTKA